MQTIIVTLGSDGEILHVEGLTRGTTLEVRAYFDPDVEPANDVEVDADGDPYEVVRFTAEGISDATA